MIKQVLSSAGLILAFGLFQSVTTPVFAQSEEGEMTIDIQITENGETRTIHRTVENGDSQSIEDILGEMNVLDDIDISGDGEKVEIRVMKFSDGEEDVTKDVDIEILSDDNFWISDINEGGFLGVYITTFHEIDGTMGAKVTKVITGSAAEKSGLKTGDIIHVVNGKTIDSEDALIKEISSHKKGETVEIGLARDGNEMLIKAKLGEREHNASAGCHKIFIDDEHGDLSEEEIMDLLHERGFGNGGMMHHRKMRMMGGGGNPNGAFLGVASMKTETIENGVKNVEEAVEGAKISEVYDNSTAKEMGLEVGDVIKEMNGQKVSDFDDVVKIMDNLEAGEELKMQVDRNGGLITVSGILKSRKEVLPFKGGKGCCSSMPTTNCCSKKVMTKDIQITIEMTETSAEEKEMLRESAKVDFDSELQINSLEFAPNPSDGLINLKFDLPLKADTRIMVLDNSGRTVYQETMKNFGGEFNEMIDITAEPNGVYFIIVAQGEKQFTSKVVKQ